MTIAQRFSGGKPGPRSSSPEGTAERVSHPIRITPPQRAALPPLDTSIILVYPVNAIMDYTSKQSGKRVNTAQVTRPAAPPCRAVAACRITFHVPTHHALAAPKPGEGGSRINSIVTGRVVPAVTRRHPHRPARAQLRHAVLPVLVTLTCRRGKAVTGTDSRASVCPLGGPACPNTRLPPSLLPGSGRFRSPVFHGTMRQLRRPRCPPSPSLFQRCARWPWTDWSCSLAGTGQSAVLAPGLCLPVAPHSGLWSQGTAVRSQVPREPSRAFAPLSDPGRTSAPRQWRRSGTVPAHYEARDSSNICPFGTQSRGFGTHCLRFVPPSRDDYARLASGWWLTVSGWDWLPTGFCRAVSSLPLLLGFSWRDRIGHFLYNFPFTF